jgi:hypothetical protein
MGASTIKLMGAGMPSLQAQLIGNTVSTIAGVGTAQSGAAALVYNVNLLTTSGGATAFVLSTQWAIGDTVTVFNTSATAALVYPPSGSAIDGGSTDASVSIAQNEGREFIKVSSTSWRSGESVLALTTLSVSGNATIGGTLDVTGATTLTSILGGDSSLGITGQAAAQGGAVVVTGGTSSTSGNAGGAVSMVGGTPGATGVGGAASVTAGAGGATSGAGGVASLTGGAGTAGNGNGGAAIITGGAKHGSGADGPAIVRSTLLVKQGAPAAKTVTAGITAAELVGGLITTTGVSAPSLHQLPTGTEIDAVLPGVATGDSFDFSIINTGTGASDDATIQVNTDVTIVGNPTMGALTDATIISGSGRFRARRSGTNTYVVYRLA